MQMLRDHHVLWKSRVTTTTTMCVMVSCCGGAELQVVRAVHGDEEIVLRELYPDRVLPLRARPRAAARSTLTSDPRP